MRDRYLIACCLFAMMAMGTYVRNQEWSDPLRLWSGAASLAPQHARPRLNLALELMKQRRYRAAEAQYRAVLRITQMGRTPLYQFNARLGALTNLGLLRVMDGDYETGERYLNLVLAEWPNNPYPLVNRGMARLAMGRCGDARADFLRAGSEAPTC